MDLDLVAAPAAVAATRMQMQDAGRLHSGYRDCANLVMGFVVSPSSFVVLVLVLVLVLPLPQPKGPKPKQQVAASGSGI